MADHAPENPLSPIRQAELWPSQGDKHSLNGIDEIPSVVRGIEPNSGQSSRCISSVRTEHKKLFRTFRDKPANPAQLINCFRENLRIFKLHYLLG